MCELGAFIIQAWTGKSFASNRKSVAAGLLCRLRLGRRLCCETYVRDDSGEAEVGMEVSPGKSVCVFDSIADLYFGKGHCVRHNRTCPVTRCEGIVADLLLICRDHV